MNDNEVTKLLEDELTPKGNESETTTNQDGDGTGKENTDTEQATFKWTDGRMVTPTEAQKLLEEFNSDYTKKSQRLSDLEKQESDKQSNVLRDKDGNELSVEDQAYIRELNRLAPYLNISKEIETVKTTVPSRAVAQINLTKEFDDMEKTFDGSKDPETGVIKPKVTRQEIFDFVQKNPGMSTQPPLVLAKIIHYDEFARYDGARLNKQVVKEDLPATERGGVGGGNSNPPTAKFDLNDGSAEKGLREFFK